MSIQDNIDRLTDSIAEHFAWLAECDGYLVGADADPDAMERLYKRLDSDLYLLWMDLQDYRNEHYG